MANQLSVLIVEDDDDARNNMKDILSLDGYKTRTESLCQPAIAAVEQDSFDAVIVDWRLPDGDGGDLIPLIVRAQPNTPVVVVTGLRDFNTALTALRSGAYDFLLKPINPDALRSVLWRIVERKQHLAKIEEAQHQLVENERLAAIGQMVAGLAHESRNAFQRSHACLEELQLDLTEMPESMKLVQKVQKALDDLHTLLEEVRNYSAPIILERRQCDLQALIEETWIQILGTKKIEHPPQFEIHSNENFPQSCFVDNNRISQVIRNVLENAVFACSDPGQINVRLVVSETDPDKIRIEISDNGNGVPEDQRETIFTPFFTTKTKGTGLGLAISRRIVDAHQGRLHVDDAPSGGACFTIELQHSK